MRIMGRGSVDGEICLLVPELRWIRLRLSLFFKAGRAFYVKLDQGKNCLTWIVFLDVLLIKLISKMSHRKGHKEQAGHYIFYLRQTNPMSSVFLVYAATTPLFM